jgi:hypothetical protein
MLLSTSQSSAIVEAPEIGTVCSKFAMSPRLQYQVTPSTPRVRPSSGLSIYTIYFLSILLLPSLRVRVVQTRLAVGAVWTPAPMWQALDTAGGVRRAGSCQYHQMAAAATFPSSLAFCIASRSSRSSIQPRPASGLKWRSKTLPLACQRAQSHLCTVL